MTNRVATMAEPTKMPVAAAAAAGKNLNIESCRFIESVKSTLLLTSATRSERPEEGLQYLSCMGASSKMITTSIPTSVRSDHDRSYGVAADQPFETRLFRKCVGQHEARRWSTARFSGSLLVERNGCILSPSGCRVPDHAPLARLVTGAVWPLFLIA